MARHRVYASITPISTSGTYGNTVSCGSRSKIQNVIIDINADYNSSVDVGGTIKVIYDDKTDEVTVFVKCQHYNVIVLDAKNI